FLIAADHRIDLAHPSGLAQVATESFQRLVPALGVWIGRSLPAPHVLEHFEYGLLVHSLLAKGLPGRFFRFGERHEQVLRRDEFVAQDLGFGQCAVEYLLEPIAQVLAGHACARYDRELRQGGIDLLCEDGGVHFEPLENRHHDALGILQESLQDVRRLDALVVLRGRYLHPLLDGLLCFEGKFLKVHLSLSHYSTIRNSVSWAHLCGPGLQRSKSVPRRDSCQLGRMKRSSRPAERFLRQEVEQRLKFSNWCEACANCRRRAGIGGRISNDYWMIRSNFPASTSSNSSLPVPISTTSRTCSGTILSKCVSRDGAIMSASRLGWR